MRKCLAATIAALMVSTAAATANIGDFDRNDDARVSESEWTEGWGENAAWEDMAGDDEVLDEEEWEQAGYDEDYDFTAFDANEDDRITEGEFQTAAFETYDEDDDGFLDEEEYAAYEDDDWF